jgi:hypothetical protein
VAVVAVAVADRWPGVCCGGPDDSSAKNDPIKTPAFAGVFFGRKKPKIPKVCKVKASRPKTAGWKTLYPEY